MNRAIGNNVSAKLAPTSKPFVQDIAEKTGMSKRVIIYLLQIANSLSADANRMVEANDLSQDTALKISRLPPSSAGGGGGIWRSSTRPSRRSLTAPPSTLAQSLRELEAAGLVEKRLIARKVPTSSCLPWKTSRDPPHELSAVPHCPETDT